MIDLSKAFDCLPHDLIIVKPNAYGFSFSSARLTHSYFPDRKKRTKINSTYSSWEEILLGVPQGSILGLILLEIFFCDLFSVVSDFYFAGYTDDNTPNVIGENTKEVTEAPEIYPKS